MSVNQCAVSINLFTLWVMWVYLLCLGTARIKYGIMVDAGSSGTRAHLYTWESGTEIPNVLPVSINGDAQFVKMSIRLAKAAKDPDVIATICTKIIEYAKDRIPNAEIQNTRIFIYCTAGMRLLPLPDQQRILNSTFEYLQKHSPFKVKPRYIRVLTGVEEGVFGWLSVNHLLGNLISGHTTGALDMGGASFQIAVESPEEGPDVYPLNVGSKRFLVFAHSYLGYGANEALRKVNLAISSIMGSDNITNPCYPIGFVQKVHKINVNGSGDRERCESLVDALLVESAEFKSVDVPKHSSYPHFVGMSSFFYLNSFLNLPPGSTLQQLADATEEFCSTNFTETQEKYPGNDYINSYCWYGAYQHALLTLGYKFTDQIAKVTKTDTINNTDLSWTIGAMLSEVSEIEFDDSKGKQPPWNVVVVLPVILGLVLFVLVRRGLLIPGPKRNKLI